MSPPPIFRIKTSDILIVFGLQEGIAKYNEAACKKGYEGGFAFWIIACSNENIRIKNHIPAHNLFPFIIKRITLLFLLDNLFSSKGGKFFRSNNVMFTSFTFNFLQDIIILKGSSPFQGIPQKIIFLPPAQVVVNKFFLRK